MTLQTQIQGWEIDIYTTFLKTFHLTSCKLLELFTKLHVSCLNFIYAFLLKYML